MTISKDVEKSIKQMTKGLYDLLQIWETNFETLEIANNKCKVNFASCFNLSLDELHSEVHQFGEEFVKNLTPTKEKLNMQTIWYRREVLMKDLNYHHSDEDGMEFIKGFIYTQTKDEEAYSEYLQENIHIEFTMKELKNEGKYYLLLERSEWISDDLAFLESKLMEWMEYEGYASNIVINDDNNNTEDRKENTEDCKEIDFFAINRAFS